MIMCSPCLLRWCLPVLVWWLICYQIGFGQVILLYLYFVRVLFCPVQDLVLWSSVPFWIVVAQGRLPVTLSLGQRQGLSPQGHPRKTELLGRVAPLTHEDLPPAPTVHWWPPTRSTAGRTQLSHIYRVCCKLNKSAITGAEYTVFKSRITTIESM